MNKEVGTVQEEHMEQPGVGGGRGLLRCMACGLEALLTVFALSVNLAAMPTLPQEVRELPLRIGAHLNALVAAVDGESAMFVVLVPALLFLYFRLAGEEKSFQPAAAGVGLFFALCLLVGQSYALADSWDPLLGTSLCRLTALLMLLGYGVFFYHMAAALFRALDRWERGPSAPELDWRLRRRLFALALGVLAVCWLPYLTLCWPGSLTYDGQYQLGQFFGQTEATNHHPWLSTLLMGKIVELGLPWSLETGIFFYVLFQSLICALVFAALCVQVRELTGSRLPFCLALLYYGLVPSWGSYAQMFVKDTLFYGLFAAFFLCLTELLRRGEKRAPGLLVGLFLLGLACAMLRNNGVYLVVPSLLCLASAFRTLRRRLLLAGMGAGVLVLYLAFVQLALPALGVAPGSSREIFSLPFQQTARYVAMYGGELTQEEIAVIDGVLDYETIAAAYDPRVADPVKNTYHGTPEAMRDYWRLWLRCGLRHPDAYLQATLNSMFGYFLPGYRYGTYGGNYFATQEPRYDIEVGFRDQAAADAVDAFSRLWSKTPGLLLLNAPGTHTWALILCTAALLRRRRVRALTAAVPLWLTLAVCCVSPVNGLVRYALPIMAAAPSLLAFTGWALRDKEREETAHG